MGDKQQAKLVTATVFDIWEQKHVEKQVSEEEAKGLNKQSITLNKTLQALMPFYKLVIIHKGDKPESAEEVEQAVLLRNDCAEEFGIESLNPRPTMLLTPAEETKTFEDAIKEDPQYEEQKDWDMPLYIIRENPPTAEKMQQIVDKCLEQKSNSPLALLDLLFGGVDKG